MSAYTRTFGDAQGDYSNYKIGCMHTKTPLETLTDLDIMTNRLISNDINGEFLSTKNPFPTLGIINSYKPSGHIRCPPISTLNHKLAKKTSKSSTTSVLVNDKNGRKQSNIYNMDIVNRTIKRNKEKTIFSEFRNDIKIEHLFQQSDKFNNQSAFVASTKLPNVQDIKCPAFIEKRFNGSLPAFSGVKIEPLDLCVQKLSLRCDNSNVTTELNTFAQTKLDIYSDSKKIPTQNVSSRKPKLKTNKFTASDCYVVKGYGSSIKSSKNKMKISDDLVFVCELEIVDAGCPTLINVEYPLNDSMITSVPGADNQIHLNCIKINESAICYPMLVRHPTVHSEASTKHQMEIDPTLCTIKEKMTDVNLLKQTETLKVEMTQACTIRTTSPIQDMLVNSREEEKLQIIPFVNATQNVASSFQPYVHEPPAFYQVNVTENEDQIFDNHHLKDDNFIGMDSSHQETDVFGYEHSLTDDHGEAHLDDMFAEDAEPAIDELDVATTGMDNNLGAAVEEVEQQRTKTEVLQEIFDRPRENEKKLAYTTATECTKLDGAYPQLSEMITQPLKLSPGHLPNEFDSPRLACSLSSISSGDLTKPESQTVVTPNQYTHTIDDSLAKRIIEELKENDQKSCKSAVDLSQQKEVLTIKSSPLGRRTISVPKRKRHEYTSHPALYESLFQHVPPVIKFVEDGQRIESLPWDFRRLLRWRASLLTPIVVKQTLMRSGFRASKLTSPTEDLETVETADWIFYFGKHMRPQAFRSIRPYQKVNHLPCSFQLGRKDRLWRNLVQMQNRFGKEGFDYMPQTFCLPSDLEALKDEWEREGSGQPWIIKPPASARGIGVRLVTKWAQVPKKRPAIVQKYLSRPYLINESKFDLRIYVYVSSINPLRVYVHQDGLVRFASQKYTNSIRCLGNRFIHLTNYSINRLNSEYVSNTNDQLAKGHKWSLRALWSYLRTLGVSPAAVWASIKDVVVKTALSTESAFNTAINSYCNHSNSVHEMFGFDIFLDEDLKPWLLEVNVSPSMHSDSPLDAKVKGSVIKDMLNIAGVRLPEESDTNGPVVVPSHISRPLHQKPTDDASSSNSSPGRMPEQIGVSVTQVNPPECKILDEEVNTVNHAPGDVQSTYVKALKRLKGPSHEWLIDSRLLMTELSRNERDKRRYYVNRASEFGLPKPHVANCSSGSSSSSSSVISCSNGRISTHRRSYSALALKISRESSMQMVDEFPEDASTDSVNSSDIDAHEERRSFVSSSSNHIEESAGFNCNNDIKRAARSLGIGPGSPDLRSYRNVPAKTSPKIVQDSRVKSLRKSVSNGNAPSSATSNSKHGAPAPLNTKPTKPHERFATATQDILDTLTPSDVRILVNMVDEMNRAGGFECVFPPTNPTLLDQYLSYFEAPRYSNLLCAAYLQKYAQDKEKGVAMLKKLCESKIHLKSAVNGDRIPAEHIWSATKRSRPVPNRKI